MTTPDLKEGLEDVVALSSSICFIDGQAGRLEYRGYTIHDLANQASFEEVVYLLWCGQLPDRKRLGTFTQELASARSLPVPVMQLIRSLPPDAVPMDVLRTGISAMALGERPADPDDESAVRTQAARILAVAPTLLATRHRLRQDLAPVEPDPSLGHAANFLYMLHGEVPDDVATRAMDTALVLHADHELNASTFSARVTAATLSDLYAAITSAIGTLKGPLHGGANEQVMGMLQRIGSEDEAPGWVAAQLEQGQRIPGFGHRVYKTEDPRARHLRRLAKDLGDRQGNSRWYRISRRVEETVKKHLAVKGIHTNVDFYSASAYTALGVPPDFFTPIFALSRIAGWAAHVMEQYQNNRLIRPRSHYVGPESQSFVPLADR